MKKSLIIFIALFFSFSLNSQKKSIDSLTKGMNMSKGVINSYTNNNKLLFEIPNEILGKEILVGYGIGTGQEKTLPYLFSKE